MAADVSQREALRPAGGTLDQPRSASPPVADDAAVVRAEHLTKRFGDVLAVDDLSFALERGTVTGFLGPNGAGKTTTLRMLLHLVEPTAGRALVLGGRYQDLERPAVSVGAVLEAADFHPGRSGRDHLFSLALAIGSDGTGRSPIARERVARRLVIDGIFGAFGTDVARFTLGAVSSSITGDPADGLLPPLAGGALLLAYAATLVTGGAFLVARRDVT